LRVVAAAALTVAVSVIGITDTQANEATEGKSWPLDVVLGKADAPNTVIEYMSLNCPHCARFAADPFPRLKKELIDTGKVKWIMRDFPLNDTAMAAAMIAHCSGDKYMAFVDAFFQTQGTWAVAKDPITAIKNVGRLGGMDAAAVDKCLADNDMVQQINARVTEASDKLKINSTPTFIINGKQAVGEKTYDEFMKLLPAVN
jgi:protein-disulfide isomerase